MTLTINTLVWWFYSSLLWKVYKLPVVGPFFFRLLQCLVHSFLVFSSTFGAVPFALWFMIESHAGKVKPLNGALVIIASYHFSIGDLVAQAVCWLVRVNRKVWGRSFPLCFSLGSFLLLGRFCFLLLWSSWGDVIMIMIIWSIFSILVIPLPPRSLIVGLFSLCDCLILWLILAGFPTVSSGIVSLLTSLKQFHMAVHLPGSVLNELHHLTDDLDLLVPQFLTPNQGSLYAVQHSSLLHGICLSFKFFIVIIQVLQNLCKEEIKTINIFDRGNGETKPSRIVPRSNTFS